MKRLINEKINMLIKDFRIKLSFDEYEKLESATSEAHLDRIAHDILMKSL